MPIYLVVISYIVVLVLSFVALFLVENERSFGQENLMVPFATLWFLAGAIYSMLGYKHFSAEVFLIPHAIVTVIDLIVIEVCGSGISKPVNWFVRLVGKIN